MFNDPKPSRDDFIAAVSNAVTLNVNLLTLTALPAAHQARYFLLSAPSAGEAIAAAGATILYLPPYSPDLNPIEQQFAKLKALLRGRSPHPRNALGDHRASARCHQPSRVPRLPRSCRLRVRLN